jgi:CDP-diacylglycerol--serine O-phosphatidyltransferase
MSYRLPDQDEAQDHAPLAPASPKRRRRILRLSTVPTMLTLGNLVCGVLAIAYVADAWAFYSTNQAAAATGRIQLAGWMILLGMVLDSLDGRIARLTQSTSEFGGALDSLADAVTFGVAPAILTKIIIQGALAWTHPRLTFLTAGFYAICAVLRLARYNVEHEDGEEPVRSFVGLPTPGAAGVLATLAISHGMLLDAWQPSPGQMAFAAHVLGLVGLTVLGLLMVSRVPYVHVGNRLLRGRKPVGRVALLLLVVMLAIQVGEEVALLAIFWGYALAGPCGVVLNVLRGRRDEVPELFD